MSCYFPTLRKTWMNFSSMKRSCFILFSKKWNNSSCTWSGVPDRVQPADEGRLHKIWQDDLYAQGCWFRRYGKERTLSLNHESPGSSWQLHQAFCLSPRHRHLRKFQVALIFKDHLDNDNYSHHYFPPALKYSSPSWATLLKKCEGLRGE